MVSFTGPALVFLVVLPVLALSVAPSPAVINIDPAISGYTATVTVQKDGNSAVVEEFNAVPVRGRVWRDIVYYCGIYHVRSFINGNQTHNTLMPESKEGSGISRILMKHHGTRAVAVRLEYELDHAVVSTGSGKFAVIAGLPPCEATFCPQLKHVQVTFVVPGKVVKIKGSVHLPSDMIEHVPGFDHASKKKFPSPIITTTLHHHKGQAQAVTSIVARMPVLHAEDPAKLPDTPPKNVDQDLTAILVGFETLEPVFKETQHKCFPPELFASLMGGAGESDLIVIACVIAVLCAGGPLCVCAGCWCWSRCVNQEGAPKIANRRALNLAGTGDNRGAPLTVSSKELRYI